MRNTIKNKGFTMVELIIYLAILAMVTVAIVGVMTSQTSIFRKSKKDLEVQTTASETYEKINDAVITILPIERFVRLLIPCDKFVF